MSTSRISWLVIFGVISALAISAWMYSASGPERRSSIRIRAPGPVTEEMETTLRRHPVTLALTALADTLPGYCPFGATATGGGFYLVHVNSPDSVRSQHTRLDQAIISAAEAETASPQDSVWISHDFELRIECDFSAVDSVTVEPDSVRLAVGESFQFTALVWRDGEVVGCGGDCAAYEGSAGLDFRQAMRLKETLDAGG